MSIGTEEDKRKFFAKLAPTHSSTALKAGDKVTYTNDYGVEFRGYKIAGFDDGQKTNSLAKYDSIVFLDKDSWWYPVSVESLTLELPMPDIVNRDIGDWS